MEGFVTTATLAYVIGLVARFLFLYMSELQGLSKSTARALWWPVDAVWAICEAGVSALCGRSYK